MLGQQSLEVPIGLVAQTQAFARFLEAIMLDIERFADVYNQGLSLYRSIHRIRSTSHPVPALRTEDGVREMPFWIWTDENPRRRSLFVRTNSSEVILTDLHNLSRAIARKDLADALAQLTQHGIYIRPKALMTTLFRDLRHAMYLFMELVDPNTINLPITSCNNSGRFNHRDT